MRQSAVCSQGINIMVSEQNLRLTKKGKIPESVVSQES